MFSSLLCGKGLLKLASIGHFINKVDSVLCIVVCKTHLCLSRNFSFPFDLKIIFEKLPSLEMLLSVVAGYY